MYGVSTGALCRASKLNSGKVIRFNQHHLGGFAVTSLTVDLRLGEAPSWDTVFEQQIQFTVASVPRLGHSEPAVAEGQDGATGPEETTLGPPVPFRRR